MWAFVVIVVTPLINYVSGCVQRSEPVCIQALFTELAIEAFNECMLEMTDFLIISQKKSGFSSQTIQYLFRELYEAAAISNAISHSGRRTFITTLSERGVSVRVIQALARHSSLATTQRYIDVSADKLRLAVETVTI